MAIDESKLKEVLHGLNAWINIVMNNSEEVFKKATDQIEAIFVQADEEKK